MICAVCFNTDLVFFLKFVTFKPKPMFTRLSAEIHISVSVSLFIPSVPFSLVGSCFAVLSHPQKGFAAVVTILSIVSFLNYADSKEADLQMLFLNDSLATSLPSQSLYKSSLQDTFQSTKLSRLILEQIKRASDITKQIFND